MRPPKNKAKEYELVPQYEATEKKTVPRIFRCPTILKDSRRGQIITDPEDNDPGETSQPKDDKLEDPVIRFGPFYDNDPGQTKDDKLEDSLIRFGPFYATGQLDGVSETKDKAWQHVTESLSKEDPGKAKEIYAAAIRRVEKEAKETYGEKIVGTNSEFRLMMVRDGCFFLQLAFLILGKSKELGYSKKNEIFGKKLDKKDIRKWIKSMFFIGNQIPLLVLTELMKEKFFQDVIAQGNWYPPPTNSLYKKVLYELLVLPQLNKGFVLEQKPCDLLHALHIMVVGSAPSDHKSVEDDFDLEANIEEENDQITFPGQYDESDLESNIEENNDQMIFPSDVENNASVANGGRLRAFLRAIGLKNVIDDHKVIFPSAIELEQAGIRIKKLKTSGGIRSIKFESYFFWANLHLPTLLVDDGIEILFRNLKTYDRVSKKNCDVSSYLRLMSDMIQTGQDVRLLKKIGIIEGSSDDTEKLPRILSRLSSERVTLTREFHNLRRKIRDYSSPWAPYKGILNLVVFLTFLQTFFTLLAYFKPP